MVGTCGSNPNDSSLFLILTLVPIDRSDLFADSSIIGYWIPNIGIITGHVSRGKMKMKNKKIKDKKKKAPSFRLSEP